MPPVNWSVRVYSRAQAAELAGLIKENAAIVIDFHAAWCGPCKMFAPIFERVAENSAGKAEFVRIDVDRLPDIAEKYSVTRIPTIAAIKNGETVHISQGLMNEPSLRELIDRLSE